MIIVSFLIGSLYTNEQRGQCLNPTDHGAVSNQVAAHADLEPGRDRLGHRVQPDGFPLMNSHLRAAWSSVRGVRAAVSKVACCDHQRVMRQGPTYTYPARKCVLHGIGAHVSDMLCIPESMDDREDRNTRLSHGCVPSRVVL